MTIEHAVGASFGQRPALVQRRGIRSLVRPPEDLQHGGRTDRDRFFDRAQTHREYRRAVQSPRRSFAETPVEPVQRQLALIGRLGQIAPAREDRRPRRAPPGLTRPTNPASAGQSRSSGGAHPCARYFAAHSSAARRCVTTEAERSPRGPNGIRLEEHERGRDDISRHVAELRHRVRRRRSPSPRNRAPRRTRRWPDPS